MSKKRIPLFAIALAIATSLLVVFSCSDVKKIVYLQDSDGNVYFSGSAVYLGQIIANSGVIPGTKISTLNIINQSGSDLTLTGSPDLISFTYQEYTTAAGALTYSTTPTLHVVLDSTSLQNNLAAGDASGDLIFTFQCSGISPSLSSVQFRRRYVIEMTDGTENYDFVFEVYGFIIGSSGWGS